MSNLQPPEPGVYFDIDFDTYLAWDAVSNTRLGQACRSLAHFELDPDIEGTPSLRLGSLTHCGVLEPLQVAQRYVVMPDYRFDAENCTKDGKQSTSAGTEYVKQKKAEFETANRDKDVVTQSEYDKVMAMVRNLSQHEFAKPLLSAAGFVEVSLVWDDPATGIRCKARCDKASADWSWIMDLKTTRDAMGFEKSILNFGYHRQMAHYSRGVHTLGLYGHRYPSCFLVVVETAPPYLVRSAPLSQSAWNVGFELCDRAMEEIELARRTKHYPGYPSPVEWELPEWATDDDELVEIGEAPE